MDRGDTSVSLGAFQDEHLALLAEWLEEPVVRGTWGEPSEPLDLAKDLPDRFRHALITEGATPVGYVRWARCGADLLDSVGCGDLPEGAVDIDLFLGGEAARGRGIGPRALDCLAQRLFAEGAPLLSLISSRDNSRAHRAFEKAGWERDRPFEDETFGSCWLFLRWAPKGT